MEKIVRLSSSMPWGHSATAIAAISTWCMANWCFPIPWLWIMWIQIFHRNMIPSSGLCFLSITDLWNHLNNHSLVLPSIDAISYLLCVDISLVLSYLVIYQKKKKKFKMSPSSSSTHPSQYFLLFTLWWLF